MKCTYTNCAKKFTAPLELFNGALVCPHCKRELSVVADFKLTAENQELFNLSELYFFRYLSPKSYDQGDQPPLNLQPEELLDCAIENCSKSAKAGNPKAVYRMGFYNEHYLEAVRSENDRIRMAFDYYASLCYSPDLSVKTEDGVKPISNKEFGMTESTENHDLIIILTQLILNDLKHTVKLGITLGKVVCKLQNPLCGSGEGIGNLVIDILMIQINIRIVRHLLKTAVDNIPHKRCKAKNTACSLTTNRTHHKGDGTNVSQLRQSSTLKSQQFIMQLLLMGCETGFQSMSPADTEVLNVLSAGTVHHSIEAVQGFNVRNQLNTILTADFRLHQPSQNISVQRVFGNHILSPLRGHDPGQLFHSFVPPVLTGSSNDTGCL